MTMLLDRHPAIVSNGEAFPFSVDDRDTYICSCGKAIDSCNFYRNVAAHLWCGDHFDSALFVREPTLRLSSPLKRLALSTRLSGRLRDSIFATIPEYRRATRAFVGAHVAFMKKATEWTGAQVYLDATKSIRRAELLLGETGHRPHLWLLVRDCRGFCWSALRNWRLSPDHVGRVARQWVEYNECAERLARKTGVTLEIVRYDSLCANPIATLRRLVEGLGVASADNSFDNTGQVHHVLGNRLRMSFDGTIKPDTEWREGFDHDALARIRAVAGRTMSRLGFDEN